MKKIALGLILVLLWGGNAFAECVQGNCTNGKGTLTYVDGSVYVGEFKDNKIHGQGVFTSKSGSRYQGEYKHGKMDGQGTYTYPNGKKITGTWVDDSPVQ